MIKLDEIFKDYMKLIKLDDKLIKLDEHMIKLDEHMRISQTITGKD